jgi:carbonic anhydrase
VRWFVLQTPLQLDAEQIQEFKDLFPDNNRPTQPLNGREIFSVDPSS